MITLKYLKLNFLYIFHFQISMEYKQISTWTQSCFYISQQSYKLPMSYRLEGASPKSHSSITKEKKDKMINLFQYNFLLTRMLLLKLLLITDNPRLDGKKIKFLHVILKIFNFFKKSLFILSERESVSREGQRENPK